jgi:hypothetical protein
LIIDFDDVLVANSLKGASPIKKDINLRPHTLELLKSLQKIRHLKIGLYSEQYHKDSYIKEIFFGQKIKWLSKSVLTKSKKKDFQKIRKSFG